MGLVNRGTGNPGFLVKWGWLIRVLAIWGFGKMGLVNRGTGNLGFW